jgi:hypothetical protein
MSRNAIIDIVAFAVFVILMVVFYFVRTPRNWKGNLMTFVIVLVGAWVVVTIGHFVH